MGKTRSLLAVATCATAVAGLTAGGALAGEITGNGKSLKQPDGSLHGRSLCAFSGLNDGYIEGTETVRTQSWGTDFGRTHIPAPPFLHPGQACNPNIGLEE